MAAYGGDFSSITSYDSDDRCPPLSLNNFQDLKSFSPPSSITSNPGTDVHSISKLKEGQCMAQLHVETQLVKLRL